MRLEDFFREHPRAAVAFSGGTDSAYLLYAASVFAGDVHAYFVKSDFQPQFELDDAGRLAEELGVKLTVIPRDILACGGIAANLPDRCYHCKQAVMQAVLDAASEDGYDLLLDGTNASDEEADRPGMRALRELRVLSPLRECGLSKDEIRRLSREAGLFTWDKPAYACLATRIPTGEAITREKLLATERAEDYLFSLGFSDFRVRRLGGCARIQVPEEQLAKLIGRREEIVRELKKYYAGVLLDMEVRA